MFTVSAIVLGKLTVSPAGPIVVDAGTTVTIDCFSSKDEQLQPVIRWFRPFLSSSYSVKDITAHNATVVPLGEGRIASRWTGQSVLRLIISSAVAQDTGNYLCVLDEREYRLVRLLVIDMSGWQLLLCSLLACHIDFITCDM